MRIALAARGASPVLTFRIAYWSRLSVSSSEDVYEKEVETRDLFNWDGGSINRLENGRLLVAFTSPYSSRTFNAEYSMVAYEVNPEGVADVSIIVPAGPCGAATAPPAATAAKGKLV